MERQRAPPKGREAENGSRGIDSRGRIPERLCRCHSRYAKEKKSRGGSGSRQRKPAAGISLSRKPTGLQCWQLPCWRHGRQRATYATTFNAPYLLYEFEDGTKIYERIDAHALDSADMSDVIMQYDHEGRVFARQSNNTLILEPDVKGLFVAADLSRTDLARGLYQDISAGMITKMSWAFTVAEESYDRETHTRTILKIKKVYDVSAVSIPANNDRLIPEIGRIVR